MVDYQNSVDPSAAPGDPGAPAAGSQAGFLNTTTGKLVVGGIAVLLVLVAIGAAAFYFVLGGGTSDSVEQPVPTQTGTTQGSGESTETPVDPPGRSLASSFTFRNVFAPTVKRTYETTEAPQASDGSTETADTGSGASVPADTLFLQSIGSENGEPVAVFIWNNQTYKVAEGEQVGSSPWKVLQINSDSVLMLYGDSQVTLSVGQGVSK